MNFISGTYFKHLCKYRYSHYYDAASPYFSVEKYNGLDIHFVKPEHLDNLVEYIHTPINLMTHNSDIGITKELFTYISEKIPIVKWFAQNIRYDHESLIPIPIGIANPKWEHGRIERFEKVISKKISKTKILHCDFNIRTNPEERLKCLRLTGLSVKEYPFCNGPDQHNSFCAHTHEQYLEDIAASFFTISPNGNGIDCHKTWEALYMGSIPIVTQSVMSYKYRAMGIPIIILEDWSQFHYLELDEYVYKKLWNDWSADQLENVFV